MKIRTLTTLTLVIFLFSCQKENTPPVPDFIITPSYGSVDSVFQFDASLSHDREDPSEVLLSRWDWQNDGVFDTEWSSNKIVLHQYYDPSEYTITLEVSDTEGLSTSTRKTCNVTDAANDTTGELTDERDGHIYKIVKIGDQWWMAENLNYGSMIPVDEDQTNNDIVEKYCFDNVEDSCDKYGGLYQWDEAMNHTQDYRTGICPSGWHVPSDGEIQLLEKHIGVTDGLKEFGWRGPNTAQRLIGGGSTGFNAIFHGYRKYTGEFVSRGTLYVWWSSTEFDANSAVYRAISPWYTKIHRANWYKKSGYSVRCIKD